MSAPVIPPRPGAKDPATAVAPSAVPSVPPRPVRSKSPAAAMADKPPADDASPDIPKFNAKLDGIAAPKPTIPLRPQKADRDASTISVGSFPSGEAGIPKFGYRAPLDPYAGDAQAPSEGTPFGASSPPYGLQVAGERQKWTDSPYYGEHATDWKEQDFSMSSEDLNKAILKSRGGPGMGTSPSMKPVPDEELGNIAHDLWSARNASSPAIDPVGDTSDKDHLGPLWGGTGKKPGEAGPGEVPEQPLDAPAAVHLSPQPTGHRGQWDPSNGDHKEQGEVPEFQDERSAGTPILASDEINRNSPMLPAFQYAPPRSTYSNDSRRQSRLAFESTEHSTTVSGAGSPNMPRAQPYGEVPDVTPLPSSDHLPAKKQTDPEPLFDDDDDKPVLRKFPSAQSARRFPSNDIWEDTPSYLQQYAEAKEEPESQDQGEYHEDAGIVYNRRSSRNSIVKLVETGDDDSDVKGQGLGETASTGTGEKSGYLGQASELGKPESQGMPQVPSTRPQRLQKATIDTSGGSSSQGATSPERRQPPAIPDRPKPSMPARPAKRDGSGSSDTASPPAPKPKPSIPARVGGKIAALRGAFAADLDKRLALGPQAPKSREASGDSAEAAEESKAPEPLEHASKSRAKGPRGRKLPTSSSAAAEPPKTGGFTFTGVWTVWEEDEEGLQVRDSVAEAVTETATAPGGGDVEPEVAPAPKGVESSLGAATSTLGDVDTNLDESKSTTEAALGGTISKEQVASPEQEEELESPVSKSIQTGEHIISTSDTEHTLRIYHEGSKDGGSVVVKEGKDGEQEVLQTSHVS